MPDPSTIASETVAHIVLQPDTTDVSKRQCPYCHQTLSSSDIFCPHCGKQLAEQLSLKKQIWIYIVSLLAPPFGLIYFFKYMRKSDEKFRRAGIIAFVLTFFSLLITFWWGIGIYNSFQQQMQQYQNLGY